MASRFLISASRSIARAAMLAAISPAVAFATDLPLPPMVTKAPPLPATRRALQLDRPLCRRASRSFVGPHACRGQWRDCRAQRADRRRRWRCDARLQLADPAPGLRARRRFRLDERAWRRQPVLSPSPILSPLLRLRRLQLRLLPPPPALIPVTTHGPNSYDVRWTSHVRGRLRLCGRQLASFSLPGASRWPI